MKWRGDPKKHYVYETECWGPPRGSVLIELGLGLWGVPQHKSLGRMLGSLTFDSVCCLDISQNWTLLPRQRQSSVLSQISLMARAGKVLAYQHTTNGLLSTVRSELGVNLYHSYQKNQSEWSFHSSLPCIQCNCFCSRTPCKTDDYLAPALNDWFHLERSIWKVWSIFPSCFFYRIPTMLFHWNCLCISQLFIRPKLIFHFPFVISSFKNFPQTLAVSDKSIWYHYDVRIMSASNLCMEN